MSRDVALPGAKDEVKRRELPGAVLFACTMNTVRSVMAAAILRHLAGNRCYVRSAGVKMGPPDPFVATVMDEIGIDVSRHSPQTLRMTKKSLNFESDELYASWQHGMELLAHVWGSDEANEGMNAFLKGRKPDFQKFRMRNKRVLDDYIDGFHKNLNEAPAMRRLRK